jgi:hypothetical protein
MISEWLKVMLDEIARKKAESEQARIDAERRDDEPSRADDGRPPDTDAVPDPAPGAVRRAR